MTLYEINEQIADILERMFDEVDKDKPLDFPNDHKGDE